MLIFKQPYWIFSKKIIYYAHNPSIKDGIFCIYLHLKTNKRYIFYRRSDKYTKIINLANEKFYEDFGKTTRYEIERAKREGVKCATTNDVSLFINMYKTQNKKKKLNSNISKLKFNIWGDSFVLRVAFIDENNPLVFHSYLLDKTIKRVRLLHSVSCLYSENNSTFDKSFISRANRLLHFEDMIYFREMGFIMYDFGGYAFNTSDKSLKGINNFKDSFGGELVLESNYESITLWMIRNLLKLFR